MRNLCRANGAAVCLGLEQTLPLIPLMRLILRGSERNGQDGIGVCMGEKFMV